MFKKKSLKNDIIKLSFILFIVFILNVYLNKVYALTEWLDDFENENYIQYKEHLIRNSTLNFIELNFTSGTFIYENFTLYTEVDEQSDITVTDYKIEWDTMKRSADSYVAYDKGANYFYEFEHYLNVKITDVEAGDANNRQFACLWYVSTIMGDGDDITADDFIGVYVRQNGINDDKYAFDLRWYQNGVQVGFFDTGDIRDIGTELYLTMNRFDNDFYLYVYTDSDRTVLDETLSMLNENNDKFRYIGFCGIGDDINDPDDYGSGYIEYLSLDLESGYINNGIFYTKDILNYVNGSTIVLLTNSTIPSGDSIEIQFSPDNSSWYSHNEILSGYDNLVEGFESIDLRDLNYSSNFYMRLNFMDGGEDSTPRLYQLRLITSANETISENGEPDESYSALLIVGLVTGLVIGIGIYISKR